MFPDTQSQRSCSQNDKGRGLILIRSKFIIKLQFRLIWYWNVAFVLTNHTETMRKHTKDCLEGCQWIHVYYMQPSTTCMKRFVFHKLKCADGLLSSFQILAWSIKRSWIYWIHQVFIAPRFSKGLVQVPLAGRLVPRFMRCQVVMLWLSNMWKIVVKCVTRCHKLQDLNCSCSFCDQMRHQSLLIFWRLIDGLQQIQELPLVDAALRSRMIKAYTGPFRMCFKICLSFRACLVMSSLLTSIV